MGGLYILHGLLITVERRISPLIDNFIGYLVHAFSGENYDPTVLRLCCGLVSDLCNDMGEQMSIYLEKIIPHL